MENQTTDPDSRPVRNLGWRILFGFLWFILLRIVTSGIIGGVVGGLAGASQADPQAGVSGNFAAGFNNGAQASREFMQEYGLYVLIFQIALFAMLCGFGILPGTGKFKKLKQP